MGNADDSMRDSAIDRFRRLTGEQAEALRLTAQGLSSKEIAPMLEVSPSAINQRLDRARAVLGLSSRRAAARAYVEWERTCEQITCDPRDIVYGPDPGSSPSSESEEQAVSAHRVRDVGMIAMGRQSTGRMVWTWVREGARPDDLSKAQRLGIIVAIAVASVMVPAGLSIVMLSLYRLAKAMWDSSLI